MNFVLHLTYVQNKKLKQFSKDSPLSYNIFLYIGKIQHISNLVVKKDYDT